LFILDGDIWNLDRHNTDCGPHPLRGFRAGTNIHYQCFDLQNGLWPDGEDKRATNYNQNGHIALLDRHHVICQDGWLLSAWRLTSHWGQVRIEYTCKHYPVKSYWCYDKYTDLNEDGTIQSLDKHYAFCSGDDEAMKGFQGQYQCWQQNWWGCRNGFRWKFHCCKADAYDPTPKPIANPTSNPIAYPTVSPTFAPVVLPIINPTASPVPNPTALPTLTPTNYPISTPTFNPTNEPTIKPTLEPTLGKPPPGISKQEANKLLAEGREQAMEVEIEEEQQDKLPAPFSVGAAKICPFSFIKKSDEVESRGGCAIISVLLLNELKLNATAFSAYICGGGNAMVNDTSLIQAGFLDDYKKSYISDIIPGSQTSVTFFLRNDFNGTKYTFTSGFHPYLTKINLPGGFVKSLIFQSTASPKMILPSECQSN